MSGFWQVTGNSTGGAAASVTINAPAASGAMIRICAIQATTSVGSALQIRDGGTVIWQLDAQVGGAGLQLGGLDIRAMTTGNLTIAFASNTVGGDQSINAQGDCVPVGYPVPVSYRE